MDEYVADADADARPLLLPLALDLAGANIFEYICVCRFCSRHELLASQQN